MIDMTDVVDSYCLGWSAPAGDDRERLLRAALTHDALYSDPGAQDLDVAELIEHVAGFHEANPGATITRVSDVDTYGTFARFEWAARLPDGTVVVEGADTVELNLDRDRLRRIIGFFGALLPRADA